MKELKPVPRPKGSKNKKTILFDTVEEIDAKIAEAEAAVTSLTEELKTKKKELKDLIKAKADAEKIAAEKKEEEAKERLLEAFAASGKSIDEVISLLQEN